MDKNTLSQYGWVVICIIVLAIMIGLATPFGNFVKQSVDNTIHSFGDKITVSLDTAGDVDIVKEMKPTAFNLTEPFASQATASETPNYMYAKQPNTTTIENAIETKPEYTYEGEPSYNDVYATGSIIRVYKNGELFGTFYLVVLGDTNCDGIVDGMDTAQIKAIKYNTGLTGAELAAGDLNGNGVIDDTRDGTTNEDIQTIADMSVGSISYKECYDNIISK